MYRDICPMCGNNYSTLISQPCTTCAPTFAKVIKRMSNDEYYLHIAEDVAKRGTCLRRIYGAVIVKDNVIISTGYNGAPRGEANCCDLGVCERKELNIPQGERYELCRSVHAEANAIITASFNDLKDSTLYLAGFDVDTMFLVDAAPCMMCARLIKNARIKELVLRHKDGSYVKKLV